MNGQVKPNAVRIMRWYTSGRKMLTRAARRTQAIITSQVYCMLQIQSWLVNKPLGYQ